MQIKTGQVFQRTMHGPNYVCLGKALINGEMKVIGTKNGNVTRDGLGKKPNSHYGPLKLHAFDPLDIKRIHQVREVNVSSVVSLSGAPEVKATRMVKVGLRTHAEVPSLDQLK